MRPAHNQGIPIMFKRLLRYCSAAAAVGLLLFVIGIATAGPVFAQTPSILQILARLQASVDAVQASLDALSAPSEVNFRLTPPVLRFQGDEGVSNCFVTNVSSATKNIRIQSLDRTGAVSFQNENPIAAGASFWFGVVNLEATRCKFTVLDGTRSDIRGSIVVKFPTGYASLPAE